MYELATSFLNSPSPSPNDSVISWAGTVNATFAILGGAITIALGALIVWGVTKVWQRYARPRPTMRMKLGMGEAWQAENVTRRTLLNAQWIAVASGGANLMESYSELGMPDFKPRTPTYMGQLPSGTTVVFNWIDKGGRRHAEVRIKEGAEEIAIVPDKLSRKRLRFE